jgi:hypothetical protein
MFNRGKFSFDVIKNINESSSVVIEEAENPSDPTPKFSSVYEFLSWSQGSFDLADVTYDFMTGVEAPDEEDLIEPYFAMEKLLLEELPFVKVRVSDKIVFGDFMALYHKHKAAFDSFMESDTVFPEWYPEGADQEDREEFFCELLVQLLNGNFSDNQAADVIKLIKNPVASAEETEVASTDLPEGISAPESVDDTSTDQVIITVDRRSTLGLDIQKDLMTKSASYFVEQDRSSITFDIRFRDQDQSRIFVLNWRAHNGVLAITSPDFDVDDPYGENYSEDEDGVGVDMEGACQSLVDEVIRELDMAEGNSRLHINDGEVFCRVSLDQDAVDENFDLTTLISSSVLKGDYYENEDSIIGSYEYEGKSYQGELTLKDNMGKYYLYVGIQYNED